MELMAPINALKDLKSQEEINIFTDSICKARNN